MKKTKSITKKTNSTKKISSPTNKKSKATTPSTIELKSSPSGSTGSYVYDKELGRVVKISNDIPSVASASGETGESSMPGPCGGGPCGSGACGINGGNIN